MRLRRIRACVASAAELYWKVHITDSNDLTWDSLELMAATYLLLPPNRRQSNELIKVSSIAELNAGLHITCIPAVVAVFRHFAPSMKFKARSLGTKLSNRKAARSSVDATHTLALEPPDSNSYVALTEPAPSFTREDRTALASGDGRASPGSREIFMTTEVVIHPSKVQTTDDKRAVRGFNW